MNDQDRPVIRELILMLLGRLEAYTFLLSQLAGCEEDSKRMSRLTEMVRDVDYIFSSGFAIPTEDAAASKHLRLGIDILSCHINLLIATGAVTVPGSIDATKLAMCQRLRTNIRSINLRIVKYNRK